MIPENEIVEILNQKGILRFSTLMVRYHLSANAAMRVVEEYKKKGLIDSNCRPTFERKLKWKPDGEDLGEDEKNPEKQDAKRNTLKKNTNVSLPKSIKKEEKIPGKKVDATAKEKFSLKAFSKKVEPSIKNTTKKSSATKKDSSKRVATKTKVSANKVNPVNTGHAKREETTKKTRKRTTKNNDIEGQMSLF